MLACDTDGKLKVVRAGRNRNAQSLGGECKIFYDDVRMRRYTDGFREQQAARGLAQIRPRETINAGCAGKPCDGCGFKKSLEV
jgi:hypothetical protein